MKNIIGRSKNFDSPTLRTALSVFLRYCSFSTIVAVVCVNAQAAEIYVDRSAEVQGTGSYAHPFTTLQSGIDIARAGDTVYVRRGVYDAIRTVRSGSRGYPISIIAENPGTVLIKASDRALDVSHSFLTFAGIIFDSSYGSHQVIRVDHAESLRFINIVARHGTTNCITLGTSRHVLIANSTIHHCINHFNPRNNADSHGITGSSVVDLVVRNTEIYLVSGDAIQLSPSRQAWDAVRVEGSRLWSGTLDEAINGWAKGQPIGENAIDTKVGATILNGQGARPKLTVIDTVAYGWRHAITNQGAFNIKESVNAVFDRVTVHDSELGFRLRYPALVRVQNAVIYDVDYAFRLEDGLQNAQILDSTIGANIAQAPFRYAGGQPLNLIVKNLLVLGAALPQAAKNDSSNLAVDETAFVNSSSQDYRLRPDAPAIDKGESIDHVPWDRDGNPRPHGPRPDIGAYEQTSP